MARVSVESVTKIFHTREEHGVLALDGVSFDIRDSEFFCIVGHSGCGKTTLLNLLAGFEYPTTGQVTIDGRTIDRPSWHQAVVFQDHALFPWYTVGQNISFGLEMKRVPKAERRRLVRYYLELVSLEGFERRYPYELSGGMKQRVGIARSLAINPAILLMDEPFGSLDAQTREYMQDELLKIWEKEKKTVVFVTHSIEEATKLADRVLVMTRRPGRVKAIQSVELPRPRDEGHPELLKIRKEIRAWLQEEMHELLAEERARLTRGDAS